MPSEKPTLLLIPGLLCDGLVWRDVMPALEAVSRPVIVEGLADYDNIPAMAEAALKAAEGPLAVAGFSLGGRIALEMAARAPERIARLALLDSGYAPAGPHEEEQRMGLVRVARQRGMEAMAQIWLPPMLKDTHRDGPIGADLLAMVLRQTPDSFARQQNALLHRPDATSGLGRIAVPTLVLTGKDDSWSPVKQNAAMAELIPGARFVVIEDAGHFTMIEHPEPVASAMRDWLAWNA